VQAPPGERGVEAAPAAAVHRLEAQVGGRGGRAAGQQGVGELEQGVGAAIEAGVEALAEVAQGAEWRVLIVHAGKCATTAARLATPPAARFKRKLEVRPKRPQTANVWAARASTYVAA